MKSRFACLVAVIEWLLLSTAAEAFAILPKTACKVATASGMKPCYAVAMASTEVPRKPKKDKITKEAQELLDVFQARASEAPDRPNLIVAQVAPSVRIAIPEEFGDEPGSLPTGKLVAALKELGFDLVLDTNTAADLTIMEEGTELLNRLKARADREAKQFPEEDPGPNPLPLFTSCCPGWLNFVEKSMPELGPYISSCKSPHMMYGAFLKEYSQQLLGEPKDKVYFTSVMPCVRKRGESDRDVFCHDGVRDVDNVITTKDLGMLLRMKEIDPRKLEPVSFDSPFQTDGTGSGAGQLFGATGGVMEAALRTAYEIVTESTLPRLEFEEVRGLEGVKEAVIPLYGEEMTGEGLPIDLRVAVCSGLGNIKQLLKKMQSGEVNYDFVEVMACPGGCINGGGQPTGGDVNKRLETIYAVDKSLPIRKSHENPTVNSIYERFVGEPGGHKAHELFHVQPVYGGKAEEDGAPANAGECDS